MAVVSASADHAATDTMASDDEASGEEAWAGTSGAQADEALARLARRVQARARTQDDAEADTDDGADADGGGRSFYDDDGAQAVADELFETADRRRRPRRIVYSRTLGCCAAVLAAAAAAVWNEWRSPRPLECSVRSLHASRFKIDVAELFAPRLSASLSAILAVRNTNLFRAMRLEGCAIHVAGRRAVVVVTALLPWCWRCYCDGPSSWQNRRPAPSSCGETTGPLSFHRCERSRREIFAEIFAEMCMAEVALNLGAISALILGRCDYRCLASARRCPSKSTSASRLSSSRTRHCCSPSSPPQRHGSRARAANPRRHRRSMTGC